jgi:SP family general alpha glucoside:H+ symporter-like MFS transporter
MASERRRSSVVQVNRENDGVLRVNDDSVRRMSKANAFIANDIADAKQASQNEKDLSIPDAIKLYKKGICFSLLFSLAVIMEGQY